jgi:REP element-mobilizing transposase RayT
MPRRLRYFPPGSLVEVTCRTLQGRLLMTPTPLVRSLTLGVLARAARLYPIEVHAFAFLSNHFHLLVTVANAQRLAQFMNYLNSNLAREIGRVVQWPERFWGRRYQAILVSSEEAAQISRLRYVLSHGCKEHLVARPEDWPGAHAGKALTRCRPIRGLWIDRSLAYRASRRGRSLAGRNHVREEQLQLAPLPCWRHLSKPRHRQRIEEMLREIEATTRRRTHETGHPPLGSARLRAQSTETRVRRIGRPAPLVHAVTHLAREELRRTYRAFSDAYRRAAGELRRGCLDAHFPAGCFPPGLPFVPAARPG